MQLSPDSKRIFSWALYDWANSAFATTVMAGFFPVFFKGYWAGDVEATESTFWLGVSVSVAGAVVALMAPFLGAMADLGGTKKRSLALFAGLGILSTGLLAVVGHGEWKVAAMLYVLATIGFLSANIFYDSLLVSVSTPATVDVVSSRGYALGYLGGGLLFLVNVLVVLNPGAIGLSGESDAIRLAFLSVAIWWGVFSLPLFRNVPEPMGGKRMTIRDAAVAGFRQLSLTFHEVRKVRMAFLFLVAYWFYVDGVDTVVTMAVDYGKAIGFQTNDLITALLLVQFVGFPFALLMGYLGQRFGPKPMIMACIVMYLLVTVMGSRLDLHPYSIFGFEISKFYGLAILIATVQGGIQALSRSFYARLIPVDKAAEFFGFYNMLGKFAAIIGPLLMGTVGRITGDPRAGIQSLAFLFVIGALILWRVDASAGRT